MCSPIVIPLNFLCVLIFNNKDSILLKINDYMKFDFQKEFLQHNITIIIIVIRDSMQIKLDCTYVFKIMLQSIYVNICFDERTNKYIVLVQV